MPDPFTDLARALRERLALIADEASRRDADQHMAHLRDISERISQLEGRLPSPVHPQLRHYLDRRSYSKALEFIEAKAD